jgi:hypothetical protein
MKKSFSAFVLSIVALTALVPTVFAAEETKNVFNKEGVRVGTSTNGNVTYDNTPEGQAASSSAKTSSSTDDRGASVKDFQNKSNLYKNADGTQNTSGGAPSTTAAASSANATSASNADSSADDKIDAEALDKAREEAGLPKDMYEQAMKDAEASTNSTSSNGNGSIKVITTENLPGGGCKELVGGDAKTKKYECTVQGGFATVQGFLGGLIKYATFITALLGVLMIVFSGLQYSLSADDEGSRTKAKGRIRKLIMGLILLFMVGFILNTIAPWIYS